MSHEVYWQGEASRTSEEEVDKLLTGHKRLQSCVGTRARLGYTGFDAQLQRILSLHCTLYVHPCVHKHMHAIHRGLEACHVSSRPVLVI